MGLYQFKQAVHLKPAGGKGRDYPLGVHEIDEAVEYDPQFMRYVGAGLIVEAEASKIVSPANFKERQQRLLDKIVAKRDAKKGAQEKAKPKAPVDDLPEDEAAFSEDSSEAPAESKKKGKRH